MIPVLDGSQGRGDRPRGVQRRFQMILDHFGAVFGFDRRLFLRRSYHVVPQRDGTDGNQKKNGNEQAGTRPKENPALKTPVVHEKTFPCIQ
jgi:hypothetical protein